MARISSVPASPTLDTSATNLQNKLIGVARQKQKYRGMFETQKSRNKTSSGDISLNIRTLASPKVDKTLKL